MYFAAFDGQLEQDPALKKLFLSYGSQKDSWKVFRVQRVGLDLNDANLLFEVPKPAAAEEEQEQQQPPVEDSGKTLDIGKLTHALLLTEVSDSVACKAYGSIEFDSSLMPKITRFQLNYNEGGHQLRWLKYGLDELRHEPRFAYKTKVMVKFSNGMQLEATSADFSPRGVQVVLPRAMEIATADQVLLTFPLLQKITRQLVLKDLDYRVVRAENDQRTLYLRAQEIEDDPHHGVKFFNDLIKRNRGKLSLLSETSEEKKLARALKNLIQKSLASCPFYLNRIQGKLGITKFVAGAEAHPFFEWYQAEQDDHQVNVAELIQNDSFSEFVQSGAHTEKTGGLLGSLDIFLQVSDEAVVFKTERELPTLAARKRFFETCRENEGSTFYALRLYLAIVERVEIRKIGEELEYIHRYAQHKSKSIAQLLTRILNVGEMLDISDYVKSYLNDA